MATPTFTIPLRPTPLVISKTCIYKTVGKVRIPLDIYLPDGGSATNRHASSHPHPIMVFIHGGGWTGGTRADYSRPLFKRFLDLHFIIVAIDYRLLPETDFKGQQEDIRDIEVWIRNNLAQEIKDQTVEVDVDKIIVTGASAGAHLALLTPKLWATPPSAILSMYGPTNMHTLPYSGQGRLSSLVIPECTPDLLVEATTFRFPPTEISVPTTSNDYTKPRGLMSMHIFRKAILAEFILKGLVKDEHGKLCLPKLGSVKKEEVDAISPLHILDTLPSSKPHPPILQIIGTEDTIFAPTHVTSFHEALKKRGVKSKIVIVPGAGHAFDIWADHEDEIDREVLKGGVKWIIGASGVRSGCCGWFKRRKEKLEAAWGRNCRCDCFGEEGAEIIGEGDGNVDESSVREGCIGAWWRWRGWRFWRMFGRGS